MSEEAKKKKKPGWGRALKLALIVAVAVAALIMLAIGVAVWTLTPDRLTPLVGKYASRYLNADVSADRVELTYWSTFPTVSLEVEGLRVISHALDSLPASERANLPAYADTLATVRRFSGGVNVWGISVGRVMLSDVEIEHPVINLVKADSLHANYDIVPASSDTTSSPLPEIAINRFAITGGAPIRFYSAADTIDVTINLTTTSLSGTDAPTYAIDIQGADSRLGLPLWTLPIKSFGADGKVRWNQEMPDRVALNDFTLSANGVKLTVDADVQFADDVHVHALKVSGDDVRVHDVISMIPPEMGTGLERLTSDMTADFTIELTKPYRLAADTVTIPDMRVRLDVPEGSFSYERLKVREVVAAIEADIRGSDLDASVLKVNRLSLTGNALAFTLSGTVTGPVKNPLIDGRFDGRLQLAALPRALWERLQLDCTGTLTGSTSIRMHLADLTSERLHYVNASGKVGLDGFRIDSHADSIDFHAFTRHASMEFGTASKADYDSITVDSLLRVRLTADTLAFTGEGMALTGTDLSIRAAARNTGSLLDTTRVTPVGFTIGAGRLALRSLTDTMNINLRDASVSATLQRFRNNARAPQLTMKVGARRVRYNDPVTRLSLTGSEAALELHPRMLRRPASPATNDSLRRAAARRRASAAIPDSMQGRENIDFDLDRSLMSWLRQWQASGNIKAKRGRLLTPYFPVRNTLTHVDVDFSTDSVVINDMRYRMGHSDFRIDGKISNIARALTSRRGSPLEMDFNISSDTININEITSAILAGAAFAQRTHDGTVPFGTDADDDSIQSAMTAAGADTARAAFIVPSNINARLNVAADQVLYADIWFQRLTGNIGVHDGAVHLDRLAGYTPMGSMDLTALYSAPTVDDLRFAAGIVVRQLHLKKFLHMLPEIDSVLPLLNEVDGIITADAAMTTELDSMMNLKFHTFNLVLKLMGDSLTLVDSHTFRTMAKWLMFRNKHENLIKSMQVELMVRDSRLDLFPFVFDIDRYRLGVSGSNTLDMNLDYHVAVLKSPLPFKFGINIKGHPGDLKIRLGRANFNENAVASTRQLTDTARINLIGEIEKVFKFGVRSGHHTKLMMEEPKFSRSEFSVADTLTHADSLIFIQGGAIEGPAVPPFPIGDNQGTDKKKEKKQRKDK